MKSRFLAAVGAGLLLGGLGVAPALANPSQPEDAVNATEPEVAPGSSVVSQPTGPSVLPLDSAAPATEPQSEEEALANLKALESDPFNWEQRETTEPLQALNEKYPDVASQLRVDATTRTIFSAYFEGADPTRLNEYLATAKEIAASSKFDVVLEPRSYTFEAQLKTAENIALYPEKYESIIGGFAMSAWADTDGSIIVHTLKGLDRTTTVEIDGFKVIVAAEPASGEPQSRAYDSSPWSPGIRIQNSYAVCTLGWKWSTWSNATKYSSTAQHCKASGAMTHNGAIVGNQYARGAASRDAMFITDRSYDARPWLTNTLAYPLIGASSPVSGSMVALSAATTGLSGPTMIDMVGYYRPIPELIPYGPLTTTWGTQCAPGDSGGPILSTTSANKTMAHGQHHGNYRTHANNSLAYCTFFDINTVSATLQATIVTG